jgi:hypothetical protein
VIAKHDYKILDGRVIAGEELIPHPESGNMILVLHHITSIQ